MRLIDRIDITDRRQFMGQTVGGMALLAASPLLGPSAKAVEPSATPSPGVTPSLVLMARDLYPHDRLQASDYAAAVTAIAAQLATVPAKAGMLTQGEIDLDVAAKALHGKTYLALGAEADRVAVLKSIEQTEFFKAMRAGMITALYNQQPLWMKFGYEGASADEGGYLHRGFSDLTWLKA